MNACPFFKSVDGQQLRCPVGLYGGFSLAADRVCRDARGL